MKNDSADRMGKFIKSVQNVKKPPKTSCLGGLMMAEKAGFEPAHALTRLLP